jgi:hypothetical protein
MKAKYRNGNIKVSIDLLNGTKERFTEDDEFYPEFAESIDVTITEKCDGKCEFCYAGCTPYGRHADLLSDYVVNKLIPSLMPYTELALNGNDLSHPQLFDFLKMLKSRNVIANLTVNQRHFMQNTELLSNLSDAGLIHGLGVSLNDSSDEEFIKEVKKFPNAVIHVIAGIFSPEDITNLQYNGLKILILGYKVKGRGKAWYVVNEFQIKKMIAILHNLLPGLINKTYMQEMFSFTSKFDVISFDNLAIKQLKLKDILPENMWENFYMGDDGSFTYFVDLVNDKFAKSSLEENLIDINDRNAVEMFHYVRRCG